MKTQDILAHIQHTLNQFKNQNLTDTTVQETLEKLKPFVEDLSKKQVTVTIKMYRIEDYALHAIVWVRQPSESRFKKPEVICVEKPTNFNKDEAYQRAMGMF